MRSSSTNNNKVTCDPRDTAISAGVVRGSVPFHHLAARGYRGYIFVAYSVRSVGTFVKDSLQTAGCVQLRDSSSRSRGLTHPPGAVAGCAETSFGQVGVGLVGDGSVSAPSPS